MLFDLPSVTKREKRNYILLRKKLLDDGFIMVQFSIYSRFCRNQQDAEKHIERIVQTAPKDGSIRILCITEKQFEDMIIVIGDLNETEKVVDKDFLVTIE